MEINRVVVGPLEENCYVLRKGNNVLVIDPGDEIDKIKKEINNDNVVGVLITHNHFDHVGALSHFDKELVHNISNLEEKEYKIKDFTFNVVYTKGHSSDSISFYFKDINSLFCGDFIFKDTIGRCDLPTGDISVMMGSINKIKTYPKDMIIYPGHGESTILDYEIKNNIYFKEV